MPKQTGIKTFFQPKSSDTSDFSQNENPKQDHSAKKTDSSIIDQLCDDKFENIKNSKLKIEIDSNECSDFENNEIEIPFSKLFCWKFEIWWGASK